MILPTSLNKCQFRLSRINANKYIGIYGIKLVKLGIIRAGRWGLARRARGVSGFHLLKSSHNCDSKFNWHICYFQIIINFFNAICKKVIKILRHLRAVIAWPFTKLAPNFACKENLAPN
jgi:hypothetical protein